MDRQIYICRWTHLYIRACEDTYINITGMYTHMYIHTYTYVHVYVYIYTNMYINWCIYKYIY